MEKDSFEPWMKKTLKYDKIEDCNCKKLIIDYPYEIIKDGTFNLDFVYMDWFQKTLIKHNMLHPDKFFNVRDILENFKKRDDILKFNGLVAWYFDYDDFFGTGTYMKDY